METTTTPVVPASTNANATPEAPKTAAVISDKKSPRVIPRVENFFKKPDAAVTPSDPSPAEAPKPVEDRVARQMAIIAKERDRVAAEKAALDERSKIPSQEAKELQELRQKYDSFEAAWKKNPLEALKSRGLEYDALINAELERQDLEANPAMKEVRELKQQLAERERERAAMEAKAAQANHQRLIDSHTSRIQSHIDGDSEKYEFLKTANAASDVFKFIKAEFDKSVLWSDGHRGLRADGMPQASIKEFKELSIQEACDLMESQYEDSWKSIANLKKVKRYFDKSESKVDKIEKTAVKERPIPLSDNNTAAPVTRSQLSRREIANRAHAALLASSRN